jgi:hypothetical protein
MLLKSRLGFSRPTMSAQNLRPHYLIALKIIPQLCTLIQKNISGQLLLIALIVFIYNWHDLHPEKPIYLRAGQCSGTTVTRPSLARSSDKIAFSCCEGLDALQRRAKYGKAVQK